MGIMKTPELPSVFVPIYSVVYGMMREMRERY